MAEKETKKNTTKISDDEILKALRKAVLASIGDSSIGKKAIEKITSPDDLSQELRTIGRKLVRKQGVQKNSKPSLTTKDIERLKAVTDSKNEFSSNTMDPKAPTKLKKITTKIPTSKKIAKKQSTTPTFSNNTILKGIAPVRRMLPAPSFFDRISISLGKGRLLIITLIILVIIVLGLPILLYKTNVQSEFLTSVAVKFDLPVAKVNGEKIGYRAFTEDVSALENFFEDEANATSYDISNLNSAPTPNQINELVLERHTRVILIRQTLSNFGEEVTDEEVQTQLNEIIRETGSEEELGKIVEDLYSWSIDDFVKKALRPLLEEERLSIFVSVNDKLNAPKKTQIDEIAAQITAGASFDEMARQLSEDVTAQNGGDLDWFAKGTMVPAFEDQVELLEVGEVSSPFKTNFGWHIVKLTDKEVSEDGIERFRASHILIDYLTLNEYITELRRTADIKILIGL